MKKVEFKLPPIADKVTSLFQPQKKATPMFNRPLANGCPHHRISRLLHVVFLTLLILISIPVITLKALTYSFIEDNRDTGFVFETTEENNESGISVVMAALPRMLHHAPAKLALVAAVLSVFLGIAHLGFVCMDWRSGKRVSTLSFGCLLGTNHTSDTSLGFSTQHHVPAHHQWDPYSLRPRLHLCDPSFHLAFPRWLRQFRCFPHGGR